MRHAFVYVGIAMVAVTAVILGCLFFVWKPVVLMQTGSRSEALFLDGITRKGIPTNMNADIGITEFETRWIYAGRAVALAEEIDPTGKKIVRTYPHYPDVKANSDWIPRDPEKPGSTLIRDPSSPGSPSR